MSEEKQEAVVSEEQQAELAKAIAALEAEEARAAAEAQSEEEEPQKVLSLAIQVDSHTELEDVAVSLNKFLKKVNKKGEYHVELRVGVNPHAKPAPEVGKIGFSVGNK